MNEPKEIPSPTLDAAIAAILDLRERRGLGLVDSAEIARTALGAAGVGEMVARIAKLEASLNAIRRHTDPDGEDGTYRFDSANDACDFAFAEAARALKSAEASE